jgi:hypothetical protein
MPLVQPMLDQQSSLWHANNTMKADVERKTAKALDLLSPIQIVALVRGTLGMGHISAPPAPSHNQCDGPR